MADKSIPNYGIINASLDFQIKDFRTNTARIYKELINPGPVQGSFYVTVYPNGADEKTEGWLVVFPNVHIKDVRYVPRLGNFSCVVSIIDVKGNSRFPRTSDDRTFYLGEYDSNANYLKRSFILDRADELLPEDVLSIRCDFNFSRIGLHTDWDIFRCAVESKPISSISQLFPFPDSLNIYLSTIPQSVCSTNGAKAEDSNDKFTVFDFTHRILTLPQFHEARERFGVYGIPPTSSSIISTSKEESSDPLEHIWISDCYPDRFLLSLEEREDNVGFRLLENSPVIRQIVNADMKEKSEKRVQFSEVDSRTFLIVLHFLENETIPSSTFREQVNVYTFSHLYEMKGLHQKCSEELGRNLNFMPVSGIDFGELKRMTYLYGDEYLSFSLDTRWRTYVNSLLDALRKGKVGRPDSDSYI